VLPTTWWIATACAAVVGAGATPALCVRGLYQLDESERSGPTAMAASAAAGAVGGAVAAQAARHAGSAWWLAALLVWAFTLVAAATCDAMTQRIPTPILRAGGLGAAALIVVAGLATQDWRALAITAVVCCAAGLILGICWRFAGAGFGDVRLATVGGVGLGHATQRSVVLALVAFIVLSMGQAIWTYVRTRDRKAHFAYGPALVLGFLVAAAAA
jgi:leader peptidase (prepilin peptidase)/N-methyltransferase